MSLPEHYTMPKFDQHIKERCRDCQERRKSNNFGNSIRCNRHDAPVSHSHRCNDWHGKGTLL